MIREHSITLSEEDILTLLKLDRVSFRHQLNQRTPTGVRGFVEYFVRGEEKITQQEVEDKLYDILLEKKVIDETFKKRNGKIETSHHWGSPDEDDFRPSVYKCTYVIYVNEYIHTSKI